MRDLLPPPEDVVRRIVIDRLAYYSQYFGVAAYSPMFTSQTAFVSMLDSHIRAYVYHFHTACIKGEEGSESREYKFDFEFELFRTWWDHLKYDLKNHRIKWLAWLPERYLKTLKVEYQKTIKSSSKVIPTKFTKICPHATVDWNKNPVPHALYLGLYKVE